MKFVSLVILKLLLKKNSKANILAVTVEKNLSYYLLYKAVVFIPVLCISVNDISIKSWLFR